MPYLLRLLAGRQLLVVAASLVLASLAAQAQAPTWSTAVTGSLTQTAGTNQTRGVATDASGNVFVTGNFTGQVYFGSTLLTSQGDNDIFVAKYVPSIGTWAWAQRAGGTGRDIGYGVAVSGTSVYLVGNSINNTANTNNVLFGGSGTSTGTVVQNGATATLSTDLVVAKYTDQGSSALLSWTQVAGGTGNDDGQGIAVSGTSIYVTGSILNNTANDSGVVFGGSGTSPGTAVQNGATATLSADIAVAKYTDNGASATLSWTQVAGGTGSDGSRGIAVSGANVYLTGVLFNSTSNAGGVLFGGSGTTAGTAHQYGAASAISMDIVVAKYLDNGPSASFTWSQVGGSGSDGDVGYGVAVSGTSIYVAGSLESGMNGSGAVFGGSGTTVGTARQRGATTAFGQDLVVAKYTDNGATASFGWSQVGGGTQNDYGQAIAVLGSSVYVSGYGLNDSANANGILFGGSGTTAGTVAVSGASPAGSYDVLVANYTDQGSSATLNWTQVGGGVGNDLGYGLAATSSGVYVGGFVNSASSTNVDSPINFGAGSGALRGTAGIRGLLGQLDPGTGSWQQVASSFNGGSSSIGALATDASGNVFATGYFNGQVYFGSTLLTSQGRGDLFVAKYTPATSTWAWAQSGGGVAGEAGNGIAVSGSSVYVTGSVTNNLANVNNVLLGSTDAAPGPVVVRGATATASSDLLVAKLLDQGSSASVVWTQVGGGTSNDSGYGLALQGSSLYVVGVLTNTTSNASGVLFGGDGATPGTVPQYGASAVADRDVVVAKYTDNGTTGTFNWSQIGGGTGSEYGSDIAVNGSSVYVAGNLFNNAANANSVVFGGSGTTAGTAVVNGASATASNDILVAKYTDQGSSAILSWTQVGGGTGSEYGNSIAVTGSSVYVAGNIFNNAANANSVVFGGNGTTAGTTVVNGASATASFDLLLAKYTDNGVDATLGWTQVGGGTSNDYAGGIAVSSTGVYVSGTITNNAANTTSVLLGGSGTTAGTVTVNGASPTASADVLVAKYLDNGTSSTLSWTQVGGGPGDDSANKLLLNGQRVLVGGYAAPPATFGSTVITGTSSSTSLLASLVDTTPLPVTLVAFTATAQGSTAVRLAWATASEANSIRFEVERSLEGVSFAKVGEVAAAGTTATAHAYALLDATLPPGAPLLYYRLRQVDTDGTAHYSLVRPVALAGARAGLRLYPNPVHGGAITLLGVSPGTRVTVFDALGRPVVSALLDATGTLGLPQGLAAGMYVVRTDTQALRLTVK
jgi:hypothetical protein